MNTRLAWGNGPPPFRLVLAAAACLVSTVSAQSVTRDLSAFSEPGVPFTVSIAIGTPPGTAVAAVEDAPPVGWTVGEISDGGSWDDQAGEVKWGLFFDPSIPTSVSYTVTSAGGAGEYCFTGLASFDGLNAATGGDTCLSVGVPTVSEWGLIAMALVMLATGSTVLRRGAASGMA